MFYLIAAIVLCCSGTMVRDVSGEIHFNKDLEDEQLDQKLKILNKPYVKSIKVESGEVFDCIDVNKQPAFDNPLLKGHKIQTSPNFFPHNLTPKSWSKRKPEAQLPRIGCPPRTVPIRRTTKEELRNHMRFDGNHRHMLQTNGRNQSLEGSNDIHIYRAIRYAALGDYDGAKTTLSLFAPEYLGDDQASGAFLWVADDKRSDDNDRITAGWMVSKQYFPDFQPRLAANWNAAGKGGCLNTLCPGFVQQHPNIALGSTFPNISTYGGDQYSVTIEIHVDPKTHAWWLVVGDEAVGYWPKELFGFLADNSAAEVQVGGTALSPVDEASPQMGSGRFPDEGYGKAAYARNIHVMAASGSLLTPFGHGYVDHRECYRFSDLKDDRPWGQQFFFGGPGGCKVSK